jgi:glutamyl-tRNA synthetase
VKKSAPHFQPPTRPQGRLAPTPTGFLHLGHALTFSTAHERAREAGGAVHLRIEDLDPLRCKPGFARAAIEDLLWLGLDWDGAPVFQSMRRARYLQAWQILHAAGLIYPCTRSRRDMATLAPHEEEPIFPPAWRADPADGRDLETPSSVNWRFRVPDGEPIVFFDGHFGRIEKVALRDFGDFLVWNRDDVPAYELAVVVDDIAMGITEVVRGADLLTSTARQILLYRALGALPPAWCHCPLVCDASGRRLAKRTGGLSLRELRDAGKTPQQVLQMAREAVPLSKNPKARSFWY